MTEEHHQHFSYVTWSTFSGVPSVMDSHLHAAGQCWDVEREVGELGQAVPRPAVLPPCLLAGELVAGREPHPEECPALWPGFRAPDQASLNLKL